MKRKLLFLATLVVSALGLRAQTDVTSTYLTNADFSATTPVTGSYLYGYGKDGSPYGFQTVDGWTSVVTAGDNSNTKYPNSGMAGGVFSYGSSTQLKGGGKAAPATSPAGEATGNCFGFFGVWSCGGYYYQNVTLPAGKYTITVPMYNQSGTQANTTYTGFFPTSGTNRTVAVNPTVGQWVNQTVTFTLAAATEGQIRIGYQSTGSGSGSNPHIFIDCVKIEFTAIVVRDVLQTAITAATNVNSRINNSGLTAAITTAQAVYDDEDATQDEVNNAATTLDTAVETAMSEHITNGGDPTLALASADLSSLDGWTTASSSSYNDKDKGLIGTYQVRFSPATVDDTHLDTEYCLGFEARWSGNFASFNQTTVTLPAGVYTLTYDVENVNSNTTSASYDDYNFVEVGGTKSYSATTEWMSAKSAWTTHTIRVTLNDPAPITVSFGYGTGSNNISADNTPALYVSHVKLAYSSFLDGAKATWQEAKAAAEEAFAKSDYVYVTGSEKEALQTEIAKAEPTTVDGYNTAADALKTATATFTAAKASYDAYAEANIIATTLSANSVTDPTTAAEAVTRAKELYVNIDTKVTSDYTFDATAIYSGDFSGSFSSTTSGQHWSDDTSKSYMDNWGSGNISATQDITLPAGSYVLKVAGRGAADAVNHKLYMSANGTTVNIPNNGDTGKGIDTSGAVNYGDGTFANNNEGRGWEWRFIPVTLTNETTITVTLTMERSGGNTWGSFSDFTILMSADNLADSDDYTALSNAINAAEAKVLGFEDGEYAPYNNVEALTKLAEAKAIKQDVANPKIIVTTATEKLNAATWTANTSDVDAIYNGTFAETGTGNNPKGWTRSNNGWGQQITGLSAEANGVNAGTTTAWYYNNNGSWQYGNDGVYVMPLAANQTYVLTFKYRKNGSDWQSWMKASVVNDSDEGLNVAQFSGADNGTTFKTVEAYFTTGAAGNYILSIEQNGNAHLTDVSLVKATSAVLAIKEDETFTPASVETYLKTVALTRTIKADTWNTFVVPFDLSNDELKAAFGDEVAVAEFSETAEGTNSTVNFNTMATPAITANKPVLLKGNAGTSFNFNGKLIKDNEAKVDGTNFIFAGTYDASTTIPANDYFIASNKLYKSSGSTTIKGTRAFLKNIGGGSTIKSMNIFDEEGNATAIDATEIEGLTVGGKVFDLSGREVKTPVRGLYIQNGKKVFIK